MTQETDLQMERLRQIVDENNARAQFIINAFNEFAKAAAEEFQPLINAFIEFGRLFEDEQTRKKQKYLTRYYRRGERMKKHKS